MNGKFWLIAFLFTLTACSHDGTLSQPQVSAPQETSITGEKEIVPTTEKEVAPTVEEEAAFDYESLKDDVLIQLDEEPRLHSPISTVVSPKPQGYTFFFREPMNRSSVENVLLDNGQKRETEEYITPNLSFHWKNDQQLRVTVKTEGDLPDFGQKRYRLDVKGATTQSGKELKQPPQFTATLYAPSQLWRMSLDGKTREQLTTFEQPYYTMQFLDAEQRYLLLGRFTVYCECDADHKRLNAIYDTKDKKQLSYPLELSTNYMGKGDFFADRRGFFFAKPEAKLSLPVSQSAVPVKLDQYVHGASFSKDHRYLLVASGKEKQTEDFDLVIIDLETGKQQHFAKALQGRPEENQMTGANMPIIFSDNGKEVTAEMWEKTAYKPIYIQLTWATGKIVVLKPGVPDNAALYSQSSDGVYKLFTNGILYKGSKEVISPIPFGQWISGTHTMVYTDYDNSASDNGPFNLQVKRFDADSNTTHEIATNLGVGLQLVGISPDGQWIYLQLF